MTTASSAWRKEYSIETTATPAAIWRLFADVPGWKRWNSGIEEIRIDGPFEAGTEFHMKPPGQEMLTSQLVEVRANECFVDETRVDDLVVRVSHRIERSGDGGPTRIVYAAEAIGPGAEEVGPMVSADFPDVLRGLADLAEQG